MSRHHLRTWGREKKALQGSKPSLGTSATHSHYQTEIDRFQHLPAGKREIPTTTTPAINDWLIERIADWDDSFGGEMQLDPVVLWHFTNIVDLVPVVWS